MNVFDLVKRFAIQEPVVYEKRANGEWVRLHQLPSYTILDVETTEDAIEAVAIDSYRAMTICCHGDSSLEAARPYAVTLHIQR